MRSEFLIDAIPHVQRCIAEFSPLSFGAEFGFEGYALNEIVDYLVSPDHYNLSLKKARGKGILYGPAHASIRRKIFNGLSISDRIDVVVPKLAYFGILELIQAFFESANPPEIQDVFDIGMGHSVYCVSTPHGYVVIKQEDFPNQQFYTYLCTELGYPSFRSSHYVGNRSWELTEYLGNLTFNDYWTQSPSIDWGIWIPQLAEHAAMGDCLGREDRHFENYVVSGDRVLPIDTSGLFGEANEAWGERYIAGGLYEICVLQMFWHDDKVFQQYLELFKVSYHDRFTALQQVNHQLRRYIHSFFGDNRTLYRHRYLAQRLGASDYPIQQMRRYQTGLIECARRRLLRDCIQSLPYEINELSDFPVIKMFRLADQRRTSNMFLLEEWEPRLMVELSALGVENTIDQDRLNAIVRVIQSSHW